MQSGSAGFPDQGPAPPRVPGFTLLRLIGQGTTGQVWLANHSTLGVWRAVKVVQRDGAVHPVAKDKELEGIRLFEPVSREDEGLVDITEVGALPEQAGFYYAMELADNANGPVSEEPPSPIKTSGFGPSGRGASDGPDSDRDRRMSATKESGAAGPDAQAVAAPHTGGGAADAAPPDVQHYAPRTLAGEVIRRGRFSVQETIELGLRLARTLDFLHSRKLVHRDIKPQNILFVGGKPKLADPGLMTRAGEHTTWCGTTGYIPPEGQGSAQADLYSLGKTLYTVSTGLPPARFPECPTDEGNRSDHAHWVLLNRVLCRACENDPRRRYGSAAELLRDLDSIASGKKPRARRKTPVVTVGLPAAAAILWVLLRGPFLSREALLVEERFDQPALDPAIWYTGHADDADPQAGTTAGGWPPTLGRGVLVFENRVTSATNSGLAVRQDIWMATENDLRKAAPGRVEIRYAVSATNGGLTVAMTAGVNRRRPDEFPRIDLFTLNQGLWPAARGATGTLVIEFSTRGPAIVRSRGGEPETIRLCDLGSLANWHLEIRSHAAAAALMHNSAARVVLDQVRIVSAPQPPRLVGYVTNIASGLPVSGVRVRNRTTGDAWTTGRDGAYAVEARAGGNELETLNPDVKLHSGARVRWLALDGFVKHDLGVSRDPPALGDALGVVRLGRAYDARLAFRAGHPLVSGAGRLVELSPDGRSSRVLSESYPGAGMICVGQQVFAVGTYGRSALFALQDNGEWKAQRRLPALWAVGITHDGRDFWICQNDRAHGEGCALYRWNPETGAAVAIATDLPIIHPAWHNGRLWVLTETGTVLEVDCGRAVEMRRLEPACRPAFETPCCVLASDGTTLWGLGPNGDTLHPLHVP